MEDPDFASPQPAMDDDPDPASPQAAVEDPDPASPQAAMEDPYPASLQVAMEDPDGASPQVGMEDPDAASLQAAVEDHDPASPQAAMEDPDPASLQAAMEDPDPASLQVAMEDPDAASPQVGMEDPDPDPASLQMAMDDPITAWLGPVGPLLRKLHSVGDEDKIRPLTVLCTTVKNLSEDKENRRWVKTARELIYDTEDYLDEVSAGASYDLSELLDRASDVNERRARFQWSPPRTIIAGAADMGKGGSVRHLTSKMSFQLPPVPPTVHVKPPNKLVELLALDDDKKTLKVIPINGFPGVGKTTVARTMYRKHGWKFQCRAFVCVSRNPDMRVLLTSMLSQLKAPRPSTFADVPDLIDGIRTHLQGKRYFVVVDDLWSTSIWSIISQAFPHGDYSSRIIITTQIEDVALATCSYDSDYIFNMEPLNDKESKKIFFHILFGYEDGCPSDIEEVSCGIIRKCGGLPLAIVNIASLLAIESNIKKEKWMDLEDLLPATSKGTKDGLNIIYNSVPQVIYNCLPPRLRTCLLYLSMYPQGSVIWKEELVNLWVAEGFLSPVEGRDMEEIAEGYFDELVSRGIIQAVETKYNSKVFSCTVHQMVLDFIRHKSMEENFIITVDYFQLSLALPDNVRRLSVQFGGVKRAYMPESIITSQVRSLMFWGFLKSLPSLTTEYRLLQVLILHIWADQENESVDLSTIHELFRLKYIKIECNVSVKLPDRIRELTHLGTLHVDASLLAVPSDISYLKKLLHLRLPSKYILPQEVALMTSLCTLGHFDLNSDSEENVLRLGQLTNLQHLQLTCSAVQPPAENMKKNVHLLGYILEKLSILQSVTLVPASDFSCNASINIPSDGFSMVSPPALLRRIELSRRCCIFFRLPEWFVELRKLCNLKIAIRQLRNEDVDILKGIPSLTALTLYIQTAPDEDRINIDKEGFQVLTYFKFVCAKPPRLFFQEGAMPKVQKLNLGFNANNRRSHTFGTVGLVNLAGLIEIFVKLGARHDYIVNIQAAESSLQDSIKYHLNSPMLRVRIQCVGVIFDGVEDQSTETELKDIARKKNMLQVHQGKKNSTEEEDSALEIQEEKKTRRHAEQHVSKLETSYARRDPSLTPLRHHQQSVQLLSGAMGPLHPELEVLSHYNLGEETEGRANRLWHEMKNTLLLPSKIIAHCFGANSSL